MTVPRPEAQNSPLAGRAVVCFSTADWDTLLPTNKHHLMRRFAQRGARVLYLETLGTRAPRLGSGTDVWRIVRRLRRGIAPPRRVERRLWVASPLVRPRWSTRADIFLNRTLFRRQMRRTLQRFPRSIAWAYSPYAVHLLPFVEPELVVYHAVDDLSAVPGADRAALREAEAQLMARADLVLCTVRPLLEKAKRIGADAHLLPNVADFKHFSRGEERTPSTRLSHVRSLPRPRILFSGNLTPHKVDFALLDHLAAERPGWQFILVGPPWEGADPPAELRRLRKRPNVHFTGHVDYEDLPPYLHAADALLIPYVLNDATRAVSPLKLFEYLSTGRPVVSSPLPSVLPYRGAIRVAGEREQWLAELEAALRDTHEMELQRRTLARRHTWSRRMAEIEALLEEKLGRE